MKLILSILLSVSCGCLFAFSAAADPSHNALPPVTMSCDNGDTITVNLGTVQNNSSVAFFVDSTTTYVSKTFTIAAGGTVVNGWDRGIQGFDPSELVTCSGSLVFQGTTFDLSTSGFFTPRG
jgi:hypothetical protein